MQQDSFDDTIFLSQFPHLHKVSIGISVVDIDNAGHPRGCRRSIRQIISFVEQFNFAAGYRDIDNAYLYVCGKLGNQRPAEIVGGAETGGVSAQWRDCRVPTPLFSAHAWKINSGQDLKAIVCCLVLFFNSREALHIGLSKAQEDVEVRILGKNVRRCEKQPRKQDQSGFHFHSDQVQKYI